MKLHSFQTVDPLLLPGLVNTALRNDCDDLDDLVKTHDIDQDALEERMASLGYRYVAATNQFRAAPRDPKKGDAEPGGSGLTCASRRSLRSRSA